MEKSIYKNYKIYTDGACKGNGWDRNFGAWAYIILVDNSIVAEDSLCVLNTTNNQMELQAVIEALNMVINYSKKDPMATYDIWVDSAYVYNCWAERWWTNWLKNGWTNSKGKEVSNIQQWEQLIPFFRTKSFVFHKATGHKDDYYNNYVDKLATKAAEEYWRI